MSNLTPAGSQLGVCSGSLKDPEQTLQCNAHSCRVLVEDQIDLTSQVVGKHVYTFPKSYGTVQTGLSKAWAAQECYMDNSIQDTKLNTPCYTLVD
jgi:hypothetical protein